MKELCYFCRVPIGQRSVTRFMAQLLVRMGKSCATSPASATRVCTVGMHSQLNVSGGLVSKSPCTN